MEVVSMLAVALVAGLALGAGFFEGLRRTVVRVPGARHPALLVLGSFAIRVVIMAGFLVVLARAGGGAALAAATAGIVLARAGVVRRSRVGGGPWS